MSAISLDPHFPGKLHCNEHLNRLKQLGLHLRGFLARYHCEPQTRDRFLQREALREEIRALEEKCTRIASGKDADRTMVIRIAEEVAKLNLEFRRLEERVHRYMKGSTY